MDDLAVRLAEVDQRGKSNSHRIDDLEKRTDTLQELTTSVKLLAANMERMASEQMKQGDRLTALEKQPGGTLEQYDEDKSSPARYPPCQAGLWGHWWQ